jgi:hypothetical protein
MQDKVNFFERVPGLWGRSDVSAESLEYSPSLAFRPGVHSIDACSSVPPPGFNLP